MDKAQIIEAIESMNVLELAELVKELEEKFGVSAAAPVAAAAPAAAAAEPLIHICAAHCPVRVRASHLPDQRPNSVQSSGRAAIPRTLVCDEHHSSQRYRSSVEQHALCAHRRAHPSSGLHRRLRRRAAGLPHSHQRGALGGLRQLPG